LDDKEQFMIPPEFDYYAARSVTEAVSLLHQHSDAKVLAGGQSLIPLMRFRLAEPAVLVDINRVPGMEYIQEENGWLKIGAMTRETMLDISEVIRDKFPLLADTTRLVGDPIVRNLATIGGNLAHADPANDHPATMLAYGANLMAMGPNGERSISAMDFFVGPFESALTHDEILTEIRIPSPAPYSGGAYMKLERKVGDFATAAVAVQITHDEAGRCTNAGIGLTNVGLTPIKAFQAEHALMGQQLDEATIQRAAQLASDAAEPEDDFRGSAEYKRALIKTLTKRALHKAMERAKGGM
jgi:carbon-monoxide dehydrogenase medium subunit